MKNKETRTLENSNKHIDHWLSQQFEDFTPNPEPALWQSIDASLDRRERQQKFIWYWLVAGVLLLVVAGAMFQWNKISNSSVASPKTVAQSNASNAAPEKNSPESLKSKFNYPNPSLKSVNTPDPIQAHELAAPSSVQFVIDHTADFVPVIIDVYPFGIESLEIEGAVNPNSVSRAATDQLAWSVDKKSDKLLGRWMIEAGVDANQTGLMYRSTADLSKYVHKNYFNHMKDGEFALSAGRFNISSVYQITKNHSVKVGVAYAENRTQQRFDFRDSMPATVVPGNKPDALGYYPIFGYLGLGPQVKFNSQTTYSMISVPFGYVGYFPLSKQYSITPEVLLQANKLSVSTGAQTLDYQTLMQTLQQVSNFRKLIWGARVAVGVEKRLNYSHAIGLRFNAQSMLTSMYIPNAALQPRGWSLGLSAHYSWRIQ
ncbi:hypothetical protein LBMAG26_14030 [Bacteroidota bacterium]|nr:hypothetical protein LBMAG26_14030 [Bacteroidota bacterium]